MGIVTTYKVESKRTTKQKGEPAMNENPKTFAPCTTFNLGGKMISFQLPADMESLIINRASEACLSAWEAGADFNIPLQEKWERILMFLEELNLL